MEKKKLLFALILILTLFPTCCGQDNEIYAKQVAKHLDLEEIHKSRKPYIVDDTEPFMVRSEDAHQHPEKAFEQTEEIQEEDNATIETCEECPQEEFFVKARKTKKRYVYLDKAPYITAGQNCDNHGYLTIRNEFKDIISIDLIHQYYEYNLMQLSSKIRIVKNGNSCFLVQDVVQYPHDIERVFL